MSLNINSSFMSRSNSEQALVDFILRTISTKSTNEIIDIHDKMELTLNELIKGGLNASQLNALPEYFIQNCIEKENIDKETLEVAGLEGGILNRIFGITEEAPKVESWETILNTDEAKPVFDDFQNPFEMHSNEKNLSKTEILELIQLNKIEIPKIKEALEKHIIEVSDLANLGLSYEFIERLQGFYIVEPEIIPFEQLPPLRNNASDIFFLGMKGSGKSTMLASLFAYANSTGVMRYKVDNQAGNKYRNELVLGMAQGYLPQSTSKEFINFIPVDMKYEGQKNYQELNFLDMAGEKFRSVAEDGINEFESYKKYLDNNNRKCLVFIIDYYENNRVETLRQDQNLQMVFTQLIAYGILEKTDAVYLVVTKADLFPSPDKKGYADSYVNSKYRNFLNTCKEAKETYKFVLKSFPYSIGPTKFQYLLEDCDPLTNSNLVEYPKLLLEQLEHDMGYKRGGGIKTWF